MGLEGLVSKHRDGRYRAGRAKDWIKVKNRSHPAMQRVKQRYMDRPPPFSGCLDIRRQTPDKKAKGELALPQQPVYNAALHHSARHRSHRGHERARRADRTGRDITKSAGREATLVAHRRTSGRRSGAGCRTEGHIIGPSLQNLRADTADELRSCAWRDQESKAGPEPGTILSAKPAMTPCAFALCMKPAQIVTTAIRLNK
jgi:hypothetical protein